MNIRYGWLVEQKVILTRMSGKITAEEFQQWADEINPFYDQIPHDKLHIVIDASEIEQLPSIKEMLNIPVHEKRGWLIVFGVPNKFVKFMASMVVQLTHTELKFVDTLVEAVNLLATVDQSIPRALRSETVEWKIVEDEE